MLKHIQGLGACMGLLFEGGDYSRAASDQGNTVPASYLVVIKGYRGN